MLLCLNFTLRLGIQRGELRFHHGKGQLPPKAKFCLIFSLSLIHKPLKKHIIFPLLLVGLFERDVDSAVLT